jgi:thiol:disulfide interchange protein DsbD
MEPGWHLYWKNPGDTGVAPTFDWQLPAGITIKDVQWPKPLRLERNGTFFFGYEKTPAWVVSIAFDESLKDGTYPITLSAFWLACDGTCIPSSQQFEFAFIVSSSAPASLSLPAVEEAKKRLPTQITGGTVTVENDRLILQLPLQGDATAHLDAIALFPELEGLFSIDHTPVWKRHDDSLELSVPCLPSARDRLVQAKQLSGLAQLTSSEITPSAVTYSFSVPYEAAIVHAFARPVPTFVQHSDWKTVDPSQELNSVHADSTMKIILLMAFLGGILLNFTPCVLPIVGMKILNLIALRNAQGVRAFPHGLLFTLGVLVAFWALAGGLYLFEYFGTSLGWGFQLQEPLFVIALTIILFCFAMNLFGVFEIGTSVSAWASEVDQQGGISSSQGRVSLSASFVSGVLATLIATPCTGPLLGSVVGFASVFRPVDGLILFTVLGLGVAFPFLIITAFPILLRLLPRPGPWMVTMKQFFGFCLLATIAWLVWVVHAEVPSVSPTALFSGMILLAFGLWILGRWGSPVRSVICRSVGKFFALLFFVTGVFVLVATVSPTVTNLMQKAFLQHTTIRWEPFSNERLDKELDEGHTVFVEVSAKWCLTCQTNKLAFLSPAVVNAFEQNAIVPLEADWTNGDPAITSLLRSLGRNGVPVYAIFKKDKEPQILPEIVTPETIITAVSSTQ